MSEGFLCWTGKIASSLFPLVPFVSLETGSRPFPCELGCLSLRENPGRGIGVARAVVGAVLAVCFVLEQV